MATYLIEIQDRLAEPSATPTTVGVYDPAGFQSAGLYGTTILGSPAIVVLINGFTSGANSVQAGAVQFGPFTAITTGGSSDNGLENAKAALAQFYTDLNAYYNA
jgi:hypothetical protein